MHGYEPVMDQSAKCSSANFKHLPIHEINSILESHLNISGGSKAFRTPTVFPAVCANMLWRVKII